MNPNEETAHIEALLRILERGESPTLNLSLGPECAKFREEMKMFLLDQLREEIRWEARVEKRGL